MDRQPSSGVLLAADIVIGAILILCLAGCEKPVPDSLIPPDKLILAASSLSGKQKERLAWNLRLTLDAYREKGSQKLIWNAAASRALIEVARAEADCLETNEPSEWIIESNCTSAIQYGCDDPMIRCLYLRHTWDEGSDPKKRAVDVWNAAFNLERSGYPPIRKYFAWSLAWSQLYSVFPNEEKFPAEVRETMQPAALEDNLRAALQDKTIPPENLYILCHDVLTQWQNDPEQVGIMTNALSKNWPDQAVAYLLKGQIDIALAWQARGGGAGNTLRDAQWQGFRDNLAAAQDALETAWKLDPTDARIPVTMIELEQGQGQGRDRMELWFSRAMALDPDNYDACQNKLQYLYPQWYGSREAMVEFGRECIQSNWGGNVPLMLAEAHRQYQQYTPDSPDKLDYWKQPDVWPDIKATFDRLFELNPGANGWYHAYAWYAYQCEQWNALNDLLPKLGRTNYTYFGGKDAFDKMASLAHENATAAK